MIYDTSGVSPKHFIIINKARVNNLKNLSVAIPKKKLIVITGLSGSGKSSLAFDTLYAEGQRRYVESLSSYARQFLGRMDKPEVDSINGIVPAIAIEQKVKTHNPRSTVGTSTEIYEYIKLLFARIGVTYSPVSGRIVKRDTVSDVTEFVMHIPPKTQVLIFSPIIVSKERRSGQQLQILLQQGFSRVQYHNQIVRIEELLLEKKDINLSDCKLVIDRIIIDYEDKDFSARVADSVQTAFYEGNGYCEISYKSENGDNTVNFSNKFELDGLRFEEPSVNMFTFNNPYGACKTCGGFGSVIGIDENLVVPDKNLSVFEGAIACWKGEKMGEYKNMLVNEAYKFDFPIHKPYQELAEEQKDLLWNGNSYFEGINDFFKMVEENSYKIQYRVMMSRYRGKTKCPDCKGTRLRKDASYVKVAGKSITDIVNIEIEQLLQLFSAIELNEHDMHIAKRLLTEIINRLSF